MVQADVAEKASEIWRLQSDVSEEEEKARAARDAANEAQRMHQAKGWGAKSCQDLFWLRDATMRVQCLSDSPSLACMARDRAYSLAWPGLMQSAYPVHMYFSCLRQGGD